MMYGIYDNYVGWGGGNMMGWFGGGIMMLVSWIFVVLLMVWIIREIKAKNSQSNNNALDILKERYAKGEINKEEFEEKKKDISK